VEEDTAPVLVSSIDKAPTAAVPVEEDVNSTLVDCVACPWCVCVCVCAVIDPLMVMPLTLPLVTEVVPAPTPTPE